MPADREALRDWLVATSCPPLALDSTGVSWQPVYNVLEGHVIVGLVNAQHIKQVAGRKPDIKDAEWLAPLLQHGLLRPSFIPERANASARWGALPPAHRARSEEHTSELQSRQ